MKSATAEDATANSAPAETWIGAATGWLALALYRAALRRMLDGRLPDEMQGAAAARLAEVEVAWRVRAAGVRALRARSPEAAWLVECFELSPLELDLLAVAVAAERELSVWPSLALLRPLGVEPGLHLGLLAELVADGRETERAALDALASDRTLARWQLIEQRHRDAPYVVRGVGVPERVIAVVLGGFVATSLAAQPGAQLDARVRQVVRELPTLADPRTREVAIHRIAAPAFGRGHELVVFAGPPGADRERLLAAVAAEHGLVVLALALDLVHDEELDAILRTAARDARLRGGVLALVADTCPARAVERCSRTLAALGRVPMITIGGDRDAARATGRDVVWIDVAPPAPADRAHLLIGAFGEARAVGDDELARIAGAYPLAPSALEHAARDAVRSAAARSERVDAGDVLTACRAQLEHRMSSLADPVRVRVGFDELVVSDELVERLAEIIAYVRHAETVYDRWGFGSRVAARGVSALFGGPPGTGKTMAASVLAGELGLELYRIDLSRVVSKYIGETEQNLARVFAEASSSHAILLFDEADSLFGRRTAVASATDRYANMEVNYLLQRMESFDGISILTSNHEAAIDEAFRRRLQFRLRFDPPDEALRERLWRTVIPAAARDAAGPLDYRALARRFDLTGGYIRNAAVRAAFASASRRHAITTDDLVEAAERETEEMGRLTQRKTR